MAVSEQVLEQEQVLVRRRARWLPRPGRRFLLFVLTTLIGAGAVAGGLWAFHEQQAGRILPGISVAGLDVGGMTPDEARAALTARLAPFSEGSVTLRSGLGSMSVTFSDVQRVPDIDTMLAAAVARGRGGTWFDETIAAIRLRLEPVAVDLRLGYDPDAAAAAVSRFADRAALRPLDATIVRGTTGFTVAAASDGWTVDVPATLAALDAVMRDPTSRAGARIDVPVVRVSPTLTTEAAVAAKTQADRVGQPVQIRSDTKTWTFNAIKIRQWIRFAWIDGTYGIVIDQAKIPNALKGIGKAVARPVRDAAFLRDKHGRIVGSMADRAGHELDVDATMGAILSELEARRTAAQAPAAVTVAMKVVAPKVTTEQAAKRAPLMVMVGSWTTHYQSSAHNGFSANITVPTRVLNGTVVAPGAVFDFWGGLGEVSLRTGYKLGGAIVGGHSVEGKALAGGICAASTTLFNAALRGGFEILTRQPHWYYITRYPLGLDATVSGSQTMRFRNDTASPILIRGFASPGYVRYEIWSVPTGRTVSLSRPQVSNVVPGMDSEVLAPDLPAGTSERIEWPVDGKDVVVTRIVRDSGGRVIHSDTFVSHYHRMIGINRIGTGPAAS